MSAKPEVYGGANPRYARLRRTPLSLACSIQPTCSGVTSPIVTRGGLRYTPPGAHTHCGSVGFASRFIRSARFKASALGKVDARGRTRLPGRGFTDGVIDAAHTTLFSPPPFLGSVCFLFCFRSLQKSRERRDPRWSCGKFIGHRLQHCEEGFSLRRSPRQARTPRVFFPSFLAFLLFLFSLLVSLLSSITDPRKQKAKTKTEKKWPGRLRQLPFSARLAT